MVSQKYMDRPTMLMALIAVIALSGAARAQQRSGSWSPAGSDDIEALLQGSLRSVAQAQAQFKLTNQRFAESLEELEWPTPPGQVIVVLSADRESWSAIAVHQVILGVRCAIHDGGAPQPLGLTTSQLEPVCSGQVDLLMLTGEDSSAVGQDLAVANPIQPDCRNWNPVNLSRPGRVILDFLTDPMGHPEPTGLRIVPSPSVQHSYAATVTLAGCTTRPVRYRGKRVAALRRLAINLRQIRDSIRDHQ
jgi:hypothetical protein